MQSCLIIPCHNEAHRLARKAVEAFIQWTPTIDLMMVDDGSVDSTAEVLQALKRTTSGRLHVLCLANNQGNDISIKKFNEYEIKFFSYTIPVDHKEDTPNLTNASISVYKESTSTFEVDVLPELLNVTGGILSEHDFMVSYNSLDSSFIFWAL